MVHILISTGSGSSPSREGNFLLLPAFALRVKDRNWSAPP